MSDEQLKEAEVSPAESEAVAESAPASGGDHEEKTQGTLDEHAQKIVNDRIGVYAGKMYAEKEAREKAERENAELRAQIATQQQAPQPTLQTQAPDPELQYSDPEQFAQQTAEYTRHIAQQEFEKQRAAAKQAEEQRLQQERDRQMNEEFIAKATKTGVDVEEALKGAAVVVNRGLSEAMRDAIMASPNSPALFSHLANNPAVFDELKGVAHNPYLAADKLKSIESDALKRNLSNTPEPTEVLNGKSAPAPEDFDRRYPGIENL